MKRWQRRKPNVLETDDIISPVRVEIRRVVIDNESRCWIEFPANLDIRPGQNVIPFRYFVGNPVHGREFAICFYKSETDRLLDRFPITDTENLPVVDFTPNTPFPNTLRPNSAIVKIYLTKDLPYDKLYANILLLS